MRLSVLSFVGLASAAAVVPRADYGYWDVSLKINSGANGWHTEAINATFNSSDLSGPISASCEYIHDPQADIKDTKVCTDGFEWSRGLDTISLTQTVELSGEQVTVRGEGELVLKCGPVTGRNCEGASRIDVSTATA
ncbi:hypothetical protein BKA66DRAFT_474427 [Pyrenochaeta sp. MPI-SDFR-AT-0127]|nr:hypothetical protein BKA66DRAFT_474427 [Pyrenochaeta sp. MPI-SDFR-AT-0127]